MTLNRVLAGVTVSDLAVAERWYTTLWERGPDARPMEGLLEWHLGTGAGLQVHAEPARAGRSGVTLADDALDALAERLRAAGVRHDGPQPGGGARILPLEDPDGNRVVVTGT
ncbi:VOC family protein [Pseudokineococcus basanitobsidens]|uniref:VOC family protein n=1 Tax=Pseudokineococcus basanitobsidens TaxID=1926649 RepID=A0ABU8RLX1_9ACTN